MNLSPLLERLDPFTAREWKGKRRIKGLQGGAKAHSIALIASQVSDPLIVVAPSTREAEHLFLDLSFFLGEEKHSSPLQKRIHLFTSWEILPFEKLSPHPDLIAARLEGLYHLMEGKAPILVSTPSALMQKVIPKEAFKQSYLYLVVGEERTQESLMDHLAAWGFQNVPLVEERGDVGIRGGILDIFPPAYPEPVRIEFDGDKIDSIRRFDPSTQRSLGYLQEFLLLPMKEFSIKSDNMNRILKEIDKRAQELDMNRREKNLILESLREGIPFPGIEFLAPYFYSSLASPFSYLPTTTLFWLDQATRVEFEAEQSDKMVLNRATIASQEGRLFPPMESLYSREKEWKEILADFRQIHSESLNILDSNETTPNSVMIVKSYLNTDLQHELSAQHGKEPALTPVANYFNKWKEEKIVVVIPDKAEALRVKGLLAFYGIDLQMQDQPFNMLQISKGSSQSLIVGSLSQGARIPEENLILITLDEILGTKKKHSAPNKTKTHPSHFISSLSELKQDDCIVHIDHGVGIYRGLKFLRVADIGGEFLHLEYQGGDRLYLPVDRINLVQKYVSGDSARPILDRLGGTSWEKVKAKIRKSVLLMAKELIEVYAVREIQEGFSYSAPDQLYQEFKASFEFNETPDQQRAIQDILSDMQKKKPMDRLICGDVGYGKTEVAIRAAFLAVMGGKQVAVLAPTTILALQHLETFRGRFHNYPVRIETLSRFSSSKESQNVIRDLSKGLVDVVIGTHRLLQKDIEFKELGLVVIDEEHRFGVAHKERLKKLRKLVDVISLTATPIPRTLHMSLIGIRDLSIIESPPVDRLAIQTYITRYDDRTIRDAVLREINRNGQVFFLHNRVETINRMAQKIMDLVPEAKIAVAHGQMATRELKSAMTNFLENRAQVLVCSAIIESGLDFPNANTIIINRADRLGLAQLYQLRGRVGRSNRRAYAYLLIPGERTMTHDAEKRLRALQELDDLGGAFKLALHDLEIRGTGNLLGKEQSGHVSAVGFELYSEMMEEAVRELKGEKVNIKLEPEIRLEISAYFPDDYIPNSNQRLLFYKRLANCSTTGELAEIREEIRDRYGSCPTPVEDLFKVMDLRRNLKISLVQQVSYHEGKLSLLFHNDSPVKVDRMLALIAEDGSRYRLSPDGRLSFNPQSQDWDGIFQEITELLQVLQ